MSLSVLLVLCMATWRLSSLFAYEDGPYGLFAKMRYAAGIRQSVLPGGVPYSEKELGKGLMCLWCNSVWMAAALTILSFLLNLVPLSEVIFYALAASTGAIAFEKWLER